ncbi:hypothetical protein F7731_07985 [Cytobacillus depressus]|uniref:Coupling factor for flagellin transcription and translation n=1 Tax=Cytobacillus depressus TaxID=1602942 RepID=A0A6L3V7Y4_9BACI|nr:hypothetical protein F7731_07985 [Cytobacillus depressus]
MSLFLNILALFSIIILFLRQNRFLQAEKKQEKMLQEMEDMISSYLIQMKEENEDFINRMNKVKNTDIPKQKPIKMEINEQKRNDSNENDFPLQNRVGKANVNKAVKAYKQSADTSVLHSEMDHLHPLDEIEMPKLEKENSTEYSLLNEVLFLKKQGLNETGIAQKLNKGKTEIELLLKFNQKSKD